jgi:hypothetical protein
MTLMMMRGGVDYRAQLAELHIHLFLMIGLNVNFNISQFPRWTLREIYCVLASALTFYLNLLCVGISIDYLYNYRFILCLSVFTSITESFYFYALFEIIKIQYFPCHFNGTVTCLIWLQITVQICSIFLLGGL